MRIKHNKTRNIAILFELLSKQLTADLLSNRESPALDIIKEYFSNTELAKEYKLYNILVTSSGNEYRANTLIETTIELYKKLNKTSLRKQHYNLIKEIKQHYNLEEFFKSKINNYKVYASVYTLFEHATSSNFLDPELIVKNKIVLLEHLTKQPTDDSTKDKFMDEYLSSDKGTRFLTYKLFVEKFNEKYSNLDNYQKEILKEYINNTNDILLKEYINNKFSDVKRELKLLARRIEDKTILIKLNEVISIIKPIGKEAIKDEDIISLLSYNELIKEIKSLE